MLIDKLKINNRIPFHMPGHKRNTELLGSDLPYDIDITEIDGFDNLHNAKGLIKNINKELSHLYGSQHSFLTVNGSTCAILAAVNSVISEGEYVLMVRNSHISAYNAVEVVKANTIFLMPEYDEYGIAGGIKPSDIENAFAENKISLVVLTSPTYEGVISDVDTISDIAHKYNCPVLVDAAHGAHLFDKFKNTKADIVVMSLHKTLPALTQCAVCNVYTNNVDVSELKNKLSVFETSSPSYVLMSSIEKCVNFVNSNQNLFKEYYENLSLFYKNLSSLKHLKQLRYNDIGKIIIFTGNTNVSGAELADILRNGYSIEIEMSSKDYIIAMTSVCDTKENLDLFQKALLEIDKTLKHSTYESENFCILPQKYCEAYSLTNNKKELLNFSDSKDRVCCEYVFAYPPGIPILAPGEIISEDIYKKIMSCIDCGIKLQSSYQNMPEKIFVKKL